jgi:hypothetical protein
MIGGEKKATGPVGARIESRSTGPVAFVSQPETES